MATQTTHYNLIKPSSADRVAVGDLNDNSDTIDGYLYQANERADQIADDYNTSSTYNTGDYCRRENYIYKCNSDSVTGNWDSTKWDRVKVMESVNELKEENDDIWDSMNVLGAKNLLYYPYYEDTETDRGITYTNNDDGTVTLSAGTPTTGSNHILVTHLELHQPLEKNTKYILSSGYDGNEVYLRLQFYNRGSIVATFSTSSGVVTIDTTGYTFNALQIQIFATSTLSNDITLYPMLRPATDQDDTYQPYAMTNKELTDVVNNVPTTAGTYTLQAVRNADNTITYSWV